MKDMERIYTVIQTERYCIAIDNIKGFYAKAEQKDFQKIRLNCKELYIMKYSLKLKLVKVFPLTESYLPTNALLI